jgi:hypothetical protein
MEVVWGGEANITYFKTGINEEECYHLHNELRKNPNQCSEYCRTLHSTFDYTQQAIQHISHSSTNFQKTISLEERLFVTLR